MLKFDLTHDEARAFVASHGFTEFLEYSESGDHGPRSREYYITPDKRRYPPNEVCPEGNLMRAEVSRVGIRWAASVPGA
jgi:hypothetical protein